MAHDTPFSARTMPRVRGDDLGRVCDRMVGDRYLVSERSGGGVRGICRWLWRAWFGRRCWRRAAGSGAGGGGRPFGLRRGERAAVLPRPDALRGSGAVGDGDGAGQGSAGDGALRLPVLREERASAGVAPGRRGVDDADGAADGERAGVGVLPRGGGPAAERGGRGELRGEAVERTTRLVGGDLERWRTEWLSDRSRSSAGTGGVERRVVRRGAGSPAVAGRTDPVRWTGTGPTTARTCGRRHNTRPRRLQWQP